MGDVIVKEITSAINYIRDWSFDPAREVLRPRSSPTRRLTEGHPCDQQIDVRYRHYAALKEWRKGVRKSTATTGRKLTAVSRVRLAIAKAERDANRTLAVLSAALNRYGGWRSTKRPRGSGIGQFCWNYSANIHPPRDRPSDTGHGWSRREQPLTYQGNMQNGTQVFMAMGYA